MRRKNKTRSILYISIIIIIGLFSTYLILNKSQQIKNGLNNIIPEIFVFKKKIPQTTLYFVGDIMMTRGVESSVKKNFNGDYSQLFKNLTELQNADILFGNLEGPVSDKGNNVGSKYSFRMSPEILPVLKNAGFDIFSFANNHIGDWNVTAYKDTLTRFSENNILKTGAGLNKEEAINPTIIIKNGIKFGFLGFSDVGPAWMEAKENNPGILLTSDPDFENIINNASKKCDILIVSFHWGEEYKTTHNTRQETLAHKAIDSGASLIIGHHPHVIQDIETYNGKPIVYSLGNFIFDQSFSRNTMKGMLFSATYEGLELKETKILINILNKKYQSEGLYDENLVKDKEEIIYSACPKPSKEYENMFSLNIGQNIGFPDKTYVPKDLVELKDLSIKPEICLIQDAKKALAEMEAAAEKDNLKIRATSAYRSYSDQKNILDNAIKNGQGNASIAIAKPGHSEHQLGTAVDLSGSSIEFYSTVSNFNNTPEDLWLRENARKYGFALSYPSGKEEITGYMYEPWHYRYIGIDNVKLMIEKEQTINEFLTQ